VRRGKYGLELRGTPFLHKRKLSRPLPKKLQDIGGSGSYGTSDGTISLTD